MEATFGAVPISGGTVGRVPEQALLTLVSADSPFDRARRENGTA